MMRFWEDDEYLEAARKLASENEDELRARLVAQALRLDDQLQQHQTAMRTALPERVRRIAEVLSRHDDLVEPATIWLEEQLRQKIAGANDNGTES